MKYSIGKISEKLNLPTSTLRYYEKQGLLINVERDENGIRMYNEDDLFWLDIIKCLRETGMSIEDIRNIVELSKVGDETIEERKNILKNHKKKILLNIKELKMYLEKIDKKIDIYENNGTCCK